MEIPEFLVRLLGTPRNLRTTLRRVKLAWAQLHGEIDLIELLTVNAISRSVAGLGKLRSVVAWWT
jgi:hypothetical protein